MLYAGLMTLEAAAGTELKGLDNAWRGAEAYHFWLLAHQQLYNGQVCQALLLELMSRAYSMTSGLHDRVHKMSRAYQALWPDLVRMEMQGLSTWLTRLASWWCVCSSTGKAPCIINCDLRPLLPIRRPGSARRFEPLSLAAGGSRPTHCIAAASL